MSVIRNPKRGLVDDIKIHNQGRSDLIAGEYFGARYSYEQTYQMIEAFKKAFIAIDGYNENTITICAPSTIASVNAFYGATEANKIINLISPGFLTIKTEYYTKALGAQTIFIFDSFLSDELIGRLHNAGVKNVIVTSIRDYMSPTVCSYLIQQGLISKDDYIESYLQKHQTFPAGMKLFNIRDFIAEGEKLKGDYQYTYSENRVVARFLTGATTSQLPKCVKLSADGFAKMGEIYNNIWFDFQPKDRLAVIIPLFYATGAIHGMHMGLLEGMTLVYQPKYDRFAFGKDLLESKATGALVAPSFVATLENAGLAEGSLNHVKYVFIGGEAIQPAQMRKFRATAKRLGIQYVLNGYGMTEAGGMVAISDKEYDDIGDVSVMPVPGAECRIVDLTTGENVEDGSRGVLHLKTPCASLGYFEEEKNKDLFTKDGWINTGDIASKNPNGKIRVFGRSTDYYVNNGISYAMFDIEETILQMNEILEAEVVKFTVAGQEYPAAIVVVKPEYNNLLSEIVKNIYRLNEAWTKMLIGVRFVSRFKTNPVTSKRDYLSLQQDLDGYYSYGGESKYYVTRIGDRKREVNEKEIVLAD